MKKDSHSIEAIRKAVDIFGSMEKFSSQVGCTQNSVYKWLHNKSVPNPISCLKIEKATKGAVKKEEIRPDFKWEHFKFHILK